LFVTQFIDLKLRDHQYFFQSFRMSQTTFDLLLSWVGPVISKSSLRRPVASATERLVVTLRYLVSGANQIELAKDYRLSPSTVGRIIKETSTAIWDVLIEKGYVKVPNTEEEW